MPAEQVTCTGDSDAERGGAPSLWGGGQERSEGHHGEAVAVAVGLHVLPEQAPALRGGVCTKLERWLSGSSSPEPGRRHRAMPAVPLG